MIKEKNDLRVDAGVSSAADATATVSYGLADKMAVQGFGSYGSDNKHYLQGAVGYYKNTGNNKIMEWYAGMGAGYAEVSESDGPGDLFGNYYLGFTQFNFGKVNSNFAHMDYGIGFKTGYLQASLTDRNYYNIYHIGDNMQEYLYPTLKDKAILFQPAAFARIGGEKLKFSL
ncbi:MAG: hypothetical protein ACQERU_07760 [Bacteroidota bacterium]